MTELTISLSPDVQFTATLTAPTGGIDVQTENDELLATLLPALQGPAGSGGLPPVTFASPQSVWVINHNLGRPVMVQAFSTGGSQVLGEVLNVTANQVSITFDQAQAGYALVT